MEGMASQTMLTQAHLNSIIGPFSWHGLAECNNRRAMTTATLEMQELLKDSGIANAKTWSHGYCTMKMSKKGVA
jgi:hypothetical protein